MNRNPLPNTQALLKMFLILIFILSGCRAAPDLKSEFHQKLTQWQMPANRPHPRILIRRQRDANALAVLKQKRDQFIADSQKLLQQGVPDFSDFKPSRNPARNMAERLAFTYQLTGDERYADMSKRVLRYMLNWPDWVVPEHKPLTVDLGVAGVACSIAMCYDWIYPELSETERREIESALRQRAILPFSRIYKAKSESWTQVQHNWRSVICGEIGITALAIHDKLSNTKELLGQAADGVIDVLEHGGQDGDWDEGVHYWGFGIGQAVLFIHSLYKFSDGALDLYQIPFLQHTGEYGLYLRTPAGDCFGYSDHENGPPRPWLMAALAARFKNQYWQWQALQDAQAKLENLVFLDETITPKAPDTLALGKRFRDTNVATLRSGWDAEAVFLGIKSGRTQVNHSHLDLNSFEVHAFAKPLLVDIDTWPYAHRSGFFEVADRRWDFECNATSGHNTLLVDGRGQSWSDSSQGHILSFHTGPALSYAVAEADKAYPGLLQQYHRFFVLYEGAVIILDDVVAEGLRHLEWLYHYESSIAEKENGRYEITNGRAQAQLLFIRPSVADERIVRHIDSKSHFHSSDGPCDRSNRYISVQPLHRQKTYRSVAAVIPFSKESPLDFTCRVIKETDEGLSLAVQFKNKNYIITFNLKQCRVEMAAL